MAASAVPFQTVRRSTVPSGRFASVRRTTEGDADADGAREDGTNPISGLCDITHHQSLCTEEGMHAPAR